MKRSADGNRAPSTPLLANQPLKKASKAVSLVLDRSCTMDYFVTYAMPGLPCDRKVTDALFHDVRSAAAQQAARMVNDAQQTPEGQVLLQASLPVEKLAAVVDFLDGVPGTADALRRQGFFRAFPLGHMPDEAAHRLLNNCGNPVIWFRLLSPAEAATTTSDRAAGVTFLCPQPVAPTFPRAQGPPIVVGPGRSVPYGWLLSRSGSPRHSRWWATPNERTR